MVDALATRAEEGRGYAAISHEELLSSRSVDLRMGQPLFRDGERLTICERQAGELKHLSTPRKRYNSRSSGERTGRSPNQPMRDSLPALHRWCCRTEWGAAAAPK